MWGVLVKSRVNLSGFSSFSLLAAEESLSGWLTWVWKLASVLCCWTVGVFGLGSATFSQIACVGVPFRLYQSQGCLSVLFPSLSEIITTKPIIYLILIDQFGNVPNYTFKQIKSSEPKAIAVFFFVLLFMSNLLADNKNKSCEHELH